MSNGKGVSISYSDKLIFLNSTIQFYIDNLSYLFEIKFVQKRSFSRVKQYVNILLARKIGLYLNKSASISETTISLIIHDLTK